MSVESIRRAYADVAGKWRGCDWPTEFGKTGLDLNGCTAAEAEAVAVNSPDPEATQWLDAARWLAQVELNAEHAEVQAAVALAAASAGDMHEALEHAQRACALETETGRPAPCACRPSWQDLKRAIEATLRGNQPAPEPPKNDAPRTLEELTDMVRDLTLKLGVLERRIDRVEKRMHQPLVAAY